MTLCICAMYLNLTKWFLIVFAFILFNVNSEIFEIILFSRLSLKDTFATLIIRDLPFTISRRFYFHKTSHMAKINPREISQLTIFQGKTYIFIT